MGKFLSANLLHLLEIFVIVVERLYHIMCKLSTVRYKRRIQLLDAETSRLREVLQLKLQVQDKLHKFRAEISTYKKQKCSEFLLKNGAFLFYAVTFSISEVS